MHDKSCDPPSSSTHVAYRFALAAGYSMVGTEDAFAVLLEDVGCRQYVALFGNLQVALGMSFEQQVAYDALEMARALGAVFCVVGGAVQCDIDEIRVTGSTYIDAAMRAVVQHRLLNTPAGASIDGGSPLEAK